MHATTHPPARRSQRGISLIEAATTLAVAAILAGAAVPSYRGLVSHTALEGRSHELATDLQWVRSEAVSRGQGLRIGFESGGGAGCYVIHTGPAGACSCAGEGPALCSSGAEPVKTVRPDANGAVRLQANVASMRFDPVRGTTSPAGTVRLIDREGRAIHHVVNIMGRARSCSPQAGVAGYRPC